MGPLEIFLSAHSERLVPETSVSPVAAALLRGMEASDCVRETSTCFSPRAEGSVAIWRLAADV